MANRKYRHNRKDGDLLLRDNHVFWPGGILSDGVQAESQPIYSASTGVNWTALDSSNTMGDYGWSHNIRKPFANPVQRVTSDDMYNATGGYGNPQKELEASMNRAGSTKQEDLNLPAGDDKKPFDWKGAATKAGIVAGGLASIYGTTKALSQPENAGIAKAAKENARDVNGMGFNTYDFDDIQEKASNFSRFKTDYTASDMLGKGFGKKAATASIGNTVNGAIAGAKVGGLWGGIAGAAVGLGSSIFGINKAKSKARKLAGQTNDIGNDANQRFYTSINMATNNAIDNQSRIQNNSYISAYGGPLNVEADYSPLTYNFHRKKHSDGGNLLIGANGDTMFAGGGHIGGGNLFAIGGDMQGNGADYSTGLTHVDAGQSHEENPYGGVQMGIAPDGQPNLVEEDETIFDNFVFSNRIKPTKEVLKMFHIGGKAGKMTYADVSKKLEKEAAERPNDPISRASLKRMLEKLAEAQEQQKAEEQAKQIQKAFSKMSPEEQQQVIAQIMAQQQAQNGGETGEENGGEEVPVDENGNPVEEAPEQSSPEEMQAMQEQQGQEISPEQAAQMQAMQQEAPEGYAYGGHMFAEGTPEYSFSDALAKIANTLGLHTAGQWDEWAAKNKIDNASYKDLKDLSQLTGNKAFMDALAAQNAKSSALANALKRGYDYGKFTYDPNSHYTVVDVNDASWNNISPRKNDKGEYIDSDGNVIKDWNWTKYWENSKDPMWRQAVDAYKTNNKIDNDDDAVKAMSKLSMEDGEKLLKDTEAWKNTTELLKNSDNALAYLNALQKNTKDPASLAAINEYLAGKVKDGKWADGYEYNFDDVFNNEQSGLWTYLADHGGNRGATVRYTYPGSFWHSLVPAKHDKDEVSMLWNPKTKNYEQVLGDVDKNWTKDGDYTWDTDEKGHTVHYYRAPDGTAETDSSNGTTEAEDEKLPYRPEWMRYAGIVGPGVGLLMNLAGVGKPDYSPYLDAMAKMHNGLGQAGMKPSGRYAVYQPASIEDQADKALGTLADTRRTYANSNMSTAAKLRAGNFLTSNAIDSIGQLTSAGRKENLANYNAALANNNGVDQHNADAFNQLSQFNAQQRSRHYEGLANLAAQYAQAKLNGDAQWAQAKYQNVGNIFNNIAKIGEDNMAWNQVAGLYNTGALGKYNHDEARGMAGDRFSNNNKKQVKARGGKLRKRKGDFMLDFNYYI